MIVRLDDPEGGRRDPGRPCAAATATGISTRPRSAQETRMSGFFTVSLTSRKEELSHVYVPGASIYRDVPHSLLPRARPMVMSLAGPEEFANCMRSSRLLCFYTTVPRNGKVKRNNIVLSRAIHRMT